MYPPEIATTLQVNPHLLKFYDSLSNEEKNILISEIKQVDNVDNYLSLLKRSRSNTTEINPWIQYDGYSYDTDYALAEYFDIGLEVLAKNKVAVIVLAGGQGTRLNVDYPKGLFQIVFGNKFKSLFEIQAARILNLLKLLEDEYKISDLSIPWLIMTSEHTFQLTKSFFIENNYFGLNSNDVIFFEQNQSPCLTFDGKLILDERFRLSFSPDGNGGLFKALEQNKLIDLLKERGVEALFVYSVDNVLVRIADPFFIGFCEKNRVDCGNKVIEKHNPHEAVGVVCQIDNKARVVEYSEITKEMAELMVGDRLRFRAANICNHYFRLDFIENFLKNNVHLMDIHVVKKKVPYIDVITEKKIQPSVSNAYKFEKFIFDIFPFAKNFKIFNVIREDEFAPLKNATGEDSPIICQEMLKKLAINIKNTKTSKEQKIKKYLCTLVE